MDAIKIATPEQVERIAANANIVPTSVVLAMGEDLAVVKQITEVDPVVFAPESSASRKLMFIWGIENFLRLTGVPCYFHHALADEANAAWREVIVHHGAEEISTGPERRYRKVL